MEEKQKQYSTFPGSQQRLTTEDQRRDKSHKCWLLSLIVFNALVLISVFVLNGLNAAGASIFNSTPGNQSDKYPLDITPAGWTFSIWGFIYAWQAAWVVYSVVNIFRRPTSSQGPPAYLSPPILPASLFVLYILANFSNTAWLFLFDRDEIQGACVALFLIAAFLVSAVGVSYKALSQYVSELVRDGRGKDVWLVRGLVHNGLAMYATWTNIAALLNLAMVITYTKGSDVSVSAASTVALGILTAEIVVFVVTDLVLLDRFSRYTLTPYVVVVVALAGSISKNWEPGATNSVFSAVLLGFGGVALLVKVVVSVYRHLTRPLTPRHLEATLGGGGEWGGNNGRMA